MEETLNGNNFNKIMAKIHHIRQFFPIKILHHTVYVDMTKTQNGLENRLFEASFYQCSFVLRRSTRKLHLYSLKGC